MDNKPCPFCGGEPKEIFLYGRACIKCTSCGALVMGCYQSETYEDVAQHWNMRTDENKDVMKALLYRIRKYGYDGEYYYATHAATSKNIDKVLTEERSD